MKRILFVDDEAPVLQGLKTRLHRLHGKWDMMFVDSGFQAVERMQQQPVDVIVTDMRMPGMDGAELLGIVNTRWPETIRIVLSGYAEQLQAIRLVPFAHQYMSKPCQPLQLENVIDRCLLLHELLSQPGLRSLVGRIRTLPTLPRIYVALQDIVRDETVTLSKVAQLVNEDSALAARVLQIVSSSFFRMARRITSIEQAVNYLGFATIRNLAMSVEVFSSWQAGGCAKLGSEPLQLHAQEVAAAASALAARTPIADDSLLAGLLHDIGYLVLAKENPLGLEEAIRLSAERRIPMYEAESEVMGASHAEIGAYLLGIWGLPFPVVEAVAHHHCPERIIHAEFDVLSALVIGQSLVHSNDASVFTTVVEFEPRIDADYLSVVKAPFDWAEAVRRVARTTESMEGVS
jgi:HD-like signal output (HDOD) protein